LNITTKIFLCNFGGGAKSLQAPSQLFSPRSLCICRRCVIVMSLLATSSSRGVIIIIYTILKYRDRAARNSLPLTPLVRMSGMSSRPLQPFGWACGADYFTNKYAKRRRAQRIVRRRLFPPPPPPPCACVSFTL
jgi:hypothetical protein